MWQQHMIGQHTNILHQYYLLTLVLLKEEVEKWGITINMNTTEIMGLLMSLWPLFLGFITLVIVLAKMHSDITVLKEKVKVAFDLINTINKK